MAKRLVPVEYEAPSAQDVARGRIVQCVDCDKPWPLWLTVPALHRCINHARTWQRERRESDRGSWRRRLHQEQAEELLELQDGKCACCERQIFLTKSPTARVDADGDAVLALVCPGCLKLVGYGEALEMAAAYMIRRAKLQRVRTTVRGGPPRADGKTVVVGRQILARAELVNTLSSDAELEAEVDQMIANATRGGRGTKP